MNKLSEIIMINGCSLFGIRWEEKWSWLKTSEIRTGLVPGKVKCGHWLNQKQSSVDNKHLMHQDATDSFLEYFFMNRSQQPCVCMVLGSDKYLNLLLYTLDKHRHLLLFYIGN